MLHPAEGGSTATGLCSRDAHRWCAPPQAVLLSKFAIFSAGTHFFVMKVISKNVHFSSSFEPNPEHSTLKIASKSHDGKYENVMWCLHWFWAMYDLFHKAQVSKNMYIRYLNSDKKNTGDQLPELVVQKVEPFPWPDQSRPLLRFDKLPKIQTI
jgi:hypothetical protein